MRCVYEGSGASDETASSRLQASSAELQDRLARLECLMETMASNSLQDTASVDGGTGIARSPTAFFETLGSRPGELGKTVFDSGGSVYVDPSCWVYLFDQIDQLRFYLESSGSQQSSANSTASPFIFPLGTGEMTPDLDLYPAIKHSELLINLFFKNVEPFCRMLHATSFRRELDQYRCQTHPCQREFEALLFTIHACSVAVLSKEALQKLFGKPKHALLEKFGYEAERALARADLLKSRNILTFQALLYHITFLLEQAQYDEGSSLIGLAVRSAQRLGLNHDPMHFNFSPWEIELRRRAWCYLQHLDFRCFENFGASSLCATLQWDCQRPKNADETKWKTCPFTNKSSEPEATAGFSDVTFVILRQELEAVQRELMRPCSNDASEIAQSKIAQYRAFVEQRYLRKFDMAEPIQRIVAAYIRSRMDQLDIIVRQNWLLSHSGNEDLGKGLFVSAVELLKSISKIESEIVSLSQESPAFSWQWMIRTSIPWHAMAIVLTNLGTFFQGPFVEDAWSQIEAVYARFSDKHCDLVSSPIWTPINNLRDQTRFKRDTWFDEEGGTPATTSASDDAPRSMMSNTLAPLFGQAIDVTAPPLNFDVDLGDRNVCFDDMVMPDLGPGDQNDFLDFYHIAPDQYNNIFTA
ncbi:MAG: hypothetical protein Q9227_004653 [Pyrenula ochraceoflavens]